MKFLPAALTVWTAITAIPGSAFGQDVIPPKVYTTTPGGVNISDGSFVYSVVDLSMGPIKFERYHVAGHLKPSDPLIGNNMSHNFDIYVTAKYKAPGPPPFPNIARRTPIVHIGRSASGTYVQSYPSSPATISAWNVDAYSGILEWISGNFVYTDKNGTIYVFNSAVEATGTRSSGSQRVGSITFPDGRIETFSYTSNSLLKMVSDSSGYAIIFDYDGSNRVSAACAFNLAQFYVTINTTCAGATPKVSYQYDSNGNLIAATDVFNQVTTYPGNMRDGMTCVMPPGYSVCKMAMTYTTYRVTQQVMADGSVWNIDPGYMQSNDPDVGGEDGEAAGRVTDPNGKSTFFSFTKSSPYSQTDANGFVTQYRFTGGQLFDYQGDPYHEGTLLTEAELPEGNKYLAEYYGPFNSVTKETIVPKPGSGLAAQERTFGYSACIAPATRQNCGKPIWIKDAKGNQIDFTYAAWGGTLSEMQPAPSAGAARPLKLFTYVQKYAYVKNAAGSLVPAAAPIWVPGTETQCQTAAGSSVAACDGAAPVTVVTYEYGADGTADNLLVRGKVVNSGGVSLRTCYGYDAQGRKIWETSPRGTSSAVCS